MKRTQVFHHFKKYAQAKDTRSMDEICDAPGGFQLQVQQQFLKDFITKHPNWRSLLLYHQIGSGKTCTSITLAETYMELNPNVKVTVILPARLRTNFFDELISPCGMNKYISEKDFKTYYSSSASTSTKNSIRSKFLKAIEQKYNIISYEKFKQEAFDATSLSAWIEKLTKNTLIIIDEVHNLISDNYDAKKYDEIVKTKVLKRAKGINTMLMKYMNTYAHDSCKMIYLTATPVFDNIVQFKELVMMLNPTAKINKGQKFSDVMTYLRGKVSYFPGTSPNAYPRVSYTEHEVAFSKTQDQVTLSIIEKTKKKKDEDDNEDSEAFMIKQRMAAIASLPDEDDDEEEIETKSVKKVKDVKTIIGNVREFAPKLAVLYNTIKHNKGKHIVYSTFVANGISIVEQLLRKHGWVSLKESLASPGNAKPYKIYAIWDGSVKDNDKLLIKKTVNDKKNMMGAKLRVILGSPSIREGVSFKHVQHLHMLDPVWNSSAKDQVEGRAIRFCSHIDIPKDHPYLKREVNVHIYKSIARQNGKVEQTCDQLIYDSIIPRKERVIKAAEEALKKVALDYHLFNKLYKENPVRTPGSIKSIDSQISIETDLYLNKLAKPKVVLKTTCPKPRRPNSRGNCPDGFYKKKNPHGDDCCYKMSKNHLRRLENPEKTVAVKTKCPSTRRPVDGKCKEGFYVKNNIYGEPCCYTMSKKQKEQFQLDGTVVAPNPSKCPATRRPVNGICPEGYYLKNNSTGQPCCYKERKSHKKAT